MTDERTPTDFALEFAEYMAKGAEAFIAAVCKQQRLQQQFEEGEGPDPLTMQDADEGVSEYMRGLTGDIYEFRKRRDRAALSASAVPEGMVQVGWQARFLCPEEGPGVWFYVLTAIDETLYRSNPNYELRPVLAAAPQPQEPT